MPCVVKALQMNHRYCAKAVEDGNYSEGGGHYIVHGGMT